MTEQLEQFVAHLKAEGIQAGEDAAANIREHAEAEARERLDAARAEAEQIREAARVEAQATLARGQAELRLAARDALLALQASLTRQLQGLLAHSVEQALNDPDWLRELLHAVILQYAKADSQSRHPIHLNLTADDQRKLAESLRDRFSESVDHADGRLEITGTLRRPGFEFKRQEATVEFTAESVAAVLGDMLDPALRRMLDEAMKPQ